MNVQEKGIIRVDVASRWCSTESKRLSLDGKVALLQVVRLSLDGAVALLQVLGLPLTVQVFDDFPLTVQRGPPPPYWGAFQRGLEGCFHWGSWG